jgi:Cell wall hydrolyses involved in spore germination
MSKEDQLVLARTIYGEARGESFLGKLAVGHVVLNRAQKKNKTITDICLQHSSKGTYQFTCWDPRDPNYEKIKDLQAGAGNEVFDQCFRAAAYAINQVTMDPTHGSTHYCTTDITPFWAVEDGKDITPAAIIGHHKFYNNIRW